MTQCPKCGFEFRARAANGEGTKIDPEVPLSELEVSIERGLRTKAEIHGMTVREMRQLLWDTGTRADYHQVQAALSRLVGRGMVNMFPMHRPPLYSWRQNG